MGLPSFGIGVVTVFGAVVCGIGVVTVRGAVDCGKAAFFWYVGVTMSLSAGASEPPHAERVPRARVPRISEDERMATRLEKLIIYPL